MSVKSDKMKKTISEAERIEASLESINQKMTQWGDIFERIDDLLGTALQKVAPKIPQG